MPAEQGEGPEPVVLATQSEVNAMSIGTSLRSSLLRIAAIGLFLVSGCAAQDATGPSEAAPEATQEPPPTERAELSIVGTDFAFDLPPSLPAGAYEFTLINRGEQVHHAQVYRLGEGVSFQEVRDGLLSRPEFIVYGLPEEAANLVVPPATGVLGTVSPGEERIGKGELERGTYVVVCLLPDLELGGLADAGNGKLLSHHALGMMAELTVT